MSTEVNENTVPEQPLLEIEQPVAEPVEEPAGQPTPPEPPFVEEKIYSYQPTDESGRPLGGKQVIKYKSEQELIDKMKEQSVLLIRKLRSETRKNRLGIVENETMPEEATLNDEYVDFKPRQLTQEESIRLSQDLLDPDKVGEATASLFEAQIGANPEALRRTLSKLQKDNAVLNAKIEAESFKKNNPDYYPCFENNDAIAMWLSRYNLAPTSQNYQKAYDTLRQAGIMLEAPKPQPVVPEFAPELPAAPVAPVAQTEPVPQEPKPAVAHIPTGLTRNQGKDATLPRPVGDDLVYELHVRDGNNKLTGEKRVYRGSAAIDMMPSEEYKRRLNSDPEFAKKVQKVLDDAQERRRRVR